MSQRMKKPGRGSQRVHAERRRSVARGCALVLLAGAGFTAAASPHALGGPFQTSPEPTTTAPAPDPVPTTIPRPDPAPPPPPPRPQPQPPPAAPPPPAAVQPPPPPPAEPPPPPPVPVAPPAAVAPPPAPSRPRPRRARVAIPRVERPVGATLAADPTVAALRVGERARHARPAATPSVLGAQFAAARTAVVAAEAPASGFDPSLVLLAVLGLGALLLVFSATPDAVLMRGPMGNTAVRARVEVGLLGGAIVALVAAAYLVVASS